MSTQTTNLGLVKPSDGEAADISVINGNMDTIDTAVGDLRESVSQKTMTMTNDRVMIPALIWSSTVFFMLIPAPPNSTTISVSSSGTLKISLYTSASTSPAEITATEVGRWSQTEGGYAKVKVTHNGSSLLRNGLTAVAYITSGTLTVTFQ